MTRSFPLDGDDWRVKGYLGLDGAIRAAGRPRAAEPGWFQATVPGSVVQDLRRAGEVPDPYVARNSLAIEWVPERAWLYRRRFKVPQLTADERLWLRFDGLDHAARIFVDGRNVAAHAGMFVPLEIDLGRTLKAGASHELAVVVEPAPASEPQVGRTSRVRVHKSRMSYGWDFCPRMIHQGIWQSVSGLVRGPAWLADVWGRPGLSGDQRAGWVDLAVTTGGEASAGHRIVASIRDGEREIAGGSSPLSDGRAALRLDVAAPRPWWPNGLGEPVVHDLEVRLLGPDGAIDRRTIPIGFRTVTLEPTPGAPADARPYGLVVNGRPTPINGWNWVPLDVLHGPPRPERLAHLVRLARAAGANLLRVWGGGLIETEAFYDACDRAGILVWQEFSLSSSGIESRPADDPAFVELLRREAEAIVPLRRNHPSLAIWCGGNELEGDDGPLDERHPVLSALRDVVERLDPGRPWLPTSPGGPHFHNRLDVIAADPGGLHDVHGPWEHQGLVGQYELWNRGTALLNSEFGVEGMAGMRQLEAIVPPADRWPANRSNPVYRHLGDWWINEPLVQEAFGGRLDRLELLARASRHLQADGLRYAVEANRRRRPRAAGSIPWQFNESYPNAWCTSAVDHRGDPKPAWFGVARAYRPVAVSAAFDRVAWGGQPSFEARIWAWNHGPELDRAEVRATVRDLEGTTCIASEAPVTLPAGATLACDVIELSPVPGRLFFLDLELGAGGRTLATSRYRFSGAADMTPLLELAPARLDVVRIPIADGDATQWHLEIVHTAGPAAVGVVIEDRRPYAAAGWAEVSDSDFELLPGERRTVLVTWADAPPSGRRLRVDAWNVDPIDVG